MKLTSQVVSGMLLLGLISCKKSDSETITFQLRNNTNIDLAKVEVFMLSPSTTPQSVLEKNTLGKGATYQQTIDGSSLPDSDGGYKIQITETNRMRSYAFGYFTNGKDLNKDYSLAIENDTINVKVTLRDL